MDNVNSAGRLSADNVNSVGGSADNVNSMDNVNSANSAIFLPEAPLR